MKQNQTSDYQIIFRTAKRIALTILISACVLAVLSYYLRNIISSDTAQIVMFVLVMGMSVFVEEIVYRKRLKQKEQDKLLSNQKDVFK